MARTTRSKASTANPKSAANSPAATQAPKSTYALSTESSDPPNVFILPKDASREARIVSLQNPRHAKPTQYLVCPETGVYEFTRVVTPKRSPRSWLVQRDGTDQEGDGQPSNDGSINHSSGYVTRNADMFVATAVDPLFLMIPALAHEPSTKSSEKRLFLSSDDYFDRLAQDSHHLSEILRWTKTRALFESRMASACDTVEAGDESMFRFNQQKLLSELLGKAQRMARGTLPQSMEDHFVIKALEAPVLGVKREEISSSSLPESEEPSRPTQQDGSLVIRPQKTDSEPQSTATAETPATSVSPDDDAGVDDGNNPSNAARTTESSSAVHASEEVISLQRLRVAFGFICASYLPTTISTRLHSLLKQQQTESEDRSQATTNNNVDLPDFGPLDEYLTHLAKLRREAAASRSIGDYSRKRVLDDDELAERAEKKRRKEEEDKRKKAGESRAVRDLKKVNTSGMKKMSDFFKKK